MGPAQIRGAGQFHAGVSDHLLERARCAPGSPVVSRERGQRFAIRVENVLSRDFAGWVRLEADWQRERDSNPKRRIFCW
jgi:hypothetical protein